MRRLAAVASLSFAALAVAPAQAYTPESGTWWNPAESGSGMFIEVQDNFLAAAVFTGDAQGRPIWYTATKFLTGNALFDGTLDLFTGVQCPGCTYTGRPTGQIGAGGSVRIVFDPNDNTRATVTWPNGRQSPYQRFHFYLKRPEDSASVPVQATKMLGEWQMVMDFSESSASSFDFYGDVLVFDEYEFDSPTNRWYFEGCRADNTEDGGCTQSGLAFHSASGFFDNASGLQVVVVDDSTANWVLYLLETGTNTGLGEITVYPKGRDPDDYSAYPMRSFRTASRTFVQEGVGPAKAKSGAADARGLSDKLAAAGYVLKAGATESKLDRAGLSEAIRSLEAHLTAKRAAR